MAYEQAYELIGLQPAWVLRDLIDRLPLRHPHRLAAKVLMQAPLRSTAPTAP
jgi:hypothetical protein